MCIHDIGGILSVSLPLFFFCLNSILSFKFIFSLTSPLILIVLCGAFYVCYKIKQGSIPTFALFGRQLNTNQQCMIVNVASVPLLYLCGAGSVLFWVLGASVFLITIHASFYNIDAVVTEEAETFLDEVV